MISLFLTFVFITFYMFYATTERIKVANHLGFEKKIQTHPSPAKKIGLMLLITSFIISINQLGFCIGILFNTIGFMTIGGLVIILAPLNLINYKNIALAIFILILIEFFQQITVL